MTVQIAILSDINAFLEHIRDSTTNSYLFI